MTIDLDVGVGVGVGSIVGSGVSVLTSGFLWYKKRLYYSGNIRTMIQKVNIPISVSLVFDSIKRKVAPRWVVWNGRLYPVEKVGLHHTYREGRTLYHVFSVASKSLFFRLVLNTDNLHWKLEEISDGLPE